MYMLIVKSASAASVQYFFDGRDPGRWSDGADRLLGLNGPVDPGDLRKVLDGRDPRTSQFLPQRAPAHRRSGWDLIWNAPKSFSVLAASGPAENNVALDAHRSAVDSLIAHLERHLTTSRKSAPGGRTSCDGLVGAAFTHRLNAAGEPHVHTHLLVANISRSDGRWSAVRPDSWFLDRRCLTALYQLELRYQLAERGCDVEWRLRSDGLADLADIPREAVRAASTQSRAVRSLGTFEARKRAVAAQRRDRVGAAAFPPQGTTTDMVFEMTTFPGTATPSTVDGNVRRHAASNLEDRRLVSAVETRLATGRSDFRTADVIVCLAACHPGGASVSEVLSWAARFCDASQPVPSRTGTPRWSTSLSVDADRRLVHAIEVGWDLRSSASHPTPPADISEIGLLEESRHPVVVLTCPAGHSRLLDQAELIDAYRQKIEADGRRLVVNTKSPSAALRWSVLAAAPTSKPGSGFDVLVVDQADRRSTAELLVLVGEARRQRAQLILVDGGTLPRLSSPASRGLQECGASRLDPPAATPWNIAATHTSERGTATQSLAPTGRDLACRVVTHWHRLSALGLDPVMVGLGIEETEGLNRAALSLRFPGGQLTSRSDRDTRMSPAWCSYGARVIMLSSGVRDVPYGTRGRVVTPSGDAEQTTVLWDGLSTPLHLDRTECSHLGFGYAVTPNVAARTTGSLLVLGPPEAVPGPRNRIIEWVRPRTDITMGRDMGQELSRASRGRGLSARARGR